MWQFFRDVSKLLFVSALTLLGFATSMNHVGLQLSEMNNSSGQNALHSNLTDIQNSRVPINGEQLEEDLEFECENPAEEVHEHKILMDPKNEKNHSYQLKKIKAKNQKIDKNCHRYGFNKVEICVKPLVLL